MRTCHSIRLLIVAILVAVRPSLFATPLEMLHDRPTDVPPTTPIARSLSKSTTPRARTVKPPATKSRAKPQTEDDISVPPLSQAYDQSIETNDDPFLIQVTGNREEAQCPQSRLDHLPLEILEAIIGHVVGHLGSTTSDPSGSQYSIRNWNAIMRHPRRKKVADLALVSHNWRRLIQERVYRHSKPIVVHHHGGSTDANFSQDTRN